MLLTAHQLISLLFIVIQNQIGRLMPTTASLYDVTIAIIMDLTASAVRSYFELKTKNYHLFLLSGYLNKCSVELPVL